MTISHGVRYFFNRVSNPLQLIYNILSTFLNGKIGAELGSQIDLKFLIIRPATDIKIVEANFETLLFALNQRSCELKIKEEGKLFRNHRHLNRKLFWRLLSRPRGHRVRIDRNINRRYRAQGDDSQLNDPVTTSRLETHDVTE